MSVAGVDSLLNGGDILREVEISSHSNLHIAEIGGADRSQNIVVQTFPKSDDSVSGALCER